MKRLVLIFAFVETSTIAQAGDVRLVDAINVPMAIAMVLGLAALLGGMSLWKKLSKGFKKAFKRQQKPY